MPNQTGPRTPEGKRRSSMNALKHGLTARSPQAMKLLADEAGPTFMEIFEEMCCHFRPADPIEMRLVRRIARCCSRLALGEAMEMRVLAIHGNMTRPGTSYERVMKYERLVDIHLHRALETLAKKRGRPMSIPQNEMPPRSR